MTDEPIVERCARIEKLCAEATQGPLIADGDDSELWGIFNSEGAELCYLTGLVGTPHPNTFKLQSTGHPDAANAALFAAAPIELPWLVGIIRDLKRQLDDALHPNLNPFSDRDVADMQRSYRDGRRRDS